MAAVFANSQEISSKSMGGKSICQFPDVCFTPPQTPATPPGVPIPYPNTGMAGDTTEGSKTVKIGGEEVMLKDRSSFKKSMGDEAGCAPKKGLINSKNTGKVYFVAWSMDVKFEGENVVRNLDMTTHNHACSPANGSVPTVHVATAAVANFDKCGTDKKKIDDNCKNGAPQCPGSLAKTVKEQKKGLRKRGGLSRTAQAAATATADASTPCVQAMRCFLRPYSPQKGQSGCCPGQTPHHVPPKSMMKKVRMKGGKRGGGVKYNPNQALCVCMEGASQHVGSHGQNHAAIDYLANKQPDIQSTGKCSVAKYNTVCAKAVAAQCGCDWECIEQQLNDQFHPNDLNKDVKHWQSNSGQLGNLSGKLDKIHDALPAPPFP